MNQVKTLILFGKWLIRRELKDILIIYLNISAINEAANVIEVIKIFNDLKPDLKFLDYQLPGGSGFVF